jgi:hypothetical protein
MSRRIIPARLAMVAVVLLICPLARGAETLKWAPKPGETLRYALSQTFDVKVKAQGQELSNKAELDVELTWKVASVAPDGAVELTQTLDRARTKLTSPGLMLVYDSQDKKTAEAPANQVWARSYEAILGKPFTIKLSPQGEVLDVKLPEGATAALAGSPLLEAADAGSFFSAAGVKNILAQLLPKLPKEPVDKGKTWDADVSVPSGPLKVVFKVKYTLAEVAPMALIDATLDTSVTPAPDAKVTVKITKQSGTARFAFDQGAGHLDSATIRQSAETTLNDGNADLAQTTDATLTFKLLK